MSAQNFTWNGKRDEAAALLAADTLTDEQIAVKVGVSRRQLATWKRHPVFMQRVEVIKAELRAAVVARGIAERQNRVEALNQRWQLLQQVMAGRAQDTRYSEPGYGTGLLLHQYKVVGSGESAQAVDEFVVDTGLLKELREHEKQAAIELGQWTEKREITGKDGGAIVITTVQAVEPKRKQHEDE